MPPARASAAPVSDRRQSARQPRSSIARPQNYYARTFAGRLSGLGDTEQTPPAPGFLPALTHFTDAVDAFPKEMIKHFSMFKEVEAKIHDPATLLQLLLDDIAQMPVPSLAQRHAGMRHQQLMVELFPENFDTLPPQEQADLRHRQKFFRLRAIMSSMLPTLDEKLVVLTAATGTKDKGLARMNSSYPHIDNEISEEARYGNPNHWAYADKEEKKKGGTTIERSRREVASANNLAAAAAAIHEVDAAALRSEARREAMMANKRSRNQHLDSDFDDSRPAKKTQTKARRIAAEAASAAEPRAYGLGISSNGAVQPRKQKKTEKALAAAAPTMERSISSALNAAAAGGRGGASPRETSITDGRKKPRAAPGPTHAKKRAALGAHSPPIASSPLAGTFASSREVIAAAQRPQSSRARQNSNANSVHSAVQDASRGRRPSSAHSNRPAANGSNAIQELELAAGVSKPALSAKEGYTPNEAAETNGAFDSATFKREEVDVPDADTPDLDPPHPAPVTTRAGRTSKTATPIGSAFPEIPMARSRSTRAANNGGSHASSETTTSGNPSKRSHKKGASISQTSLPAAKDSIEIDDETASSPAAELSDEVGEDGDEPRYCYCNEVSYGEMVACDNGRCPREWFHLGCVNLDKPPNSRTKWYCSDECKDAIAARKEKKSRPGSRA
ncbi:uncharacterized protein BDZ99DRAFT_439868 [Mytilinidion resinicola]|uniref:Chromatin modification-related protein n=1 Tax=Mytilinidion resinicola TaxID=574789 RepID=A0A6A6YXG7_9PEZI|nr:uncharacterized protein BDZ99DRAFT_439868 [Mytilinidion resinicola]KAF2812617.1 hypothetical protein BDZ99DRAFT_439868 [Mytilinidion resinicola]